LTSASAFIPSASATGLSAPNPIASILVGATGHLNDHKNIENALWYHDYYLSSSSALAVAIPDRTGTGSLVFNTSPTLSSPTLSSPSVSGTTFSTVALITTPIVGRFEFDAVAPSFTINTTASSRGPVAVNLFTSNTAATNLANVATAQNIFPTTNQTIVLVANTTYEMEMWFSVSTTGATSNALQLGFFSGALTSIGYMVHATQNATSAVTITAANNLWIATNASTAITSAVATATYRNVFVKGIVRSGVATTFTPQITYSAAPGVAPVIAPNAYLKLVPLATDTTLSSTAWHN